MIRIKRKGNYQVLVDLYVTYVMQELHNSRMHAIHYLYCDYGNIKTIQTSLFYYPFLSDFLTTDTV